MTTALLVPNRRKIVARLTPDWSTICDIVTLRSPRSPINPAAASRTRASIGSSASLSSIANGCSSIRSNKVSCSLLTHRLDIGKRMARRLSART
ncbi:Uncharacterised protein [Mycobacteroides abscessus subsp. abscessus]|nr:Uncharacterised protein [Mycobacteroides abscessus subsp. abscessus]